MPFYGAKTVNAKGDTLYYRVPDVPFAHQVQLVEKKQTNGKEDSNAVFLLQTDTTLLIDTTSFPVYIILFLDDNLRKENYKLIGLYDYIQYKSEDLKKVPVFLVSTIEKITESKAVLNKKHRGTFDSLHIQIPTFYPLVATTHTNRDAYFAGKPDYVLPYFAVLIDKNRHIRGYYDPNQNSEVKRMIQEYKHLKTKDAYANTLQQNELQKK